MKALLLSAGFGTRFKPYTLKQAKPTIPFLNIPLIGYSLYYAKAFGCNEAVINTHHLPETIFNCVENLSSINKIKTHFINESPTILDSGGGIKNAEKELSTDDHFLVFNTDIPHILPNFDFNQLLENHKNSGALVSFVTCDLEGLGNTVKGVWTKTNSNQVLDIGLGPKQDLICKHYSGIMLISKKLFSLQPSKKPHNIIYDVILPAIKNNHFVQTYHISSLRWFETGNLNDYLKASFICAQDFIKNKENPESKELQSIFDFYNMKNFEYSTDKLYLLTLNKNHLELIQQMSGTVILGNEVLLQSDANIKDSIIYNSETNLNSNIFNKLML